MPRDEDASEPKGWIRGNTKIGPVLEGTTRFLQSKYGVEIRIESVNKDNSHSWVRISHGLNKLVTDLIDKQYDDNEQETSETKSEEFALKTNVLAFASRSKAKAKPRRRDSASLSTKSIPIGERTWTDVEPGEYSISDYEVSKKLIHLSSSWKSVYPEKMMERLNSGESKTIFRNISCIVTIGLMKSGRASWEEEEETRTYFSIVLIHQEQFCTSELSKVIQDATSLILHYRTMSLFRTVSSSTCMYHVGCAINLHSIINSGLIPGGQNLSNRETVFFLLVDPMDKEHKDPDTIDLGAPRRAQYMHKAWKKSKHGVLGRHQSCSKERIEVLSDTIERHHASRNTPSLLYPESCSDGNWRRHIRKSICVTSASSKDFLET